VFVSIVSLSLHAELIFSNLSAPVDAILTSSFTFRALAEFRCFFLLISESSSKSSSSTLLFNEVLRDELLDAVLPLSCVPVRL
jgi:hypothetical protein